MKTMVVVALCACCLAFHVLRTPSYGQADKPVAPSDNEIRAKQTLGRAIASPDDKFFLYEWSRPYNWLRDLGSLPPNVAQHMQTWLYKVDVNQSPPTSEYVFFPEPGASYWLGSLSPDSKQVSFYMLDEENRLRTGVWDMAKSKLTWFKASPDGKRLNRAPVWLSNQELVYPGPSGLIRANVATGRAEDCRDCQALVEKAAAATSKERKGTTASELDAQTRLLTRSANAELAVYAKDSPDSLSLMFKKKAQAPQTVFENKRH